eukprot:2165322-Prymnesium_polylepis.1
MAAAHLRSVSSPADGACFFWSVLLLHNPRHPVVTARMPSGSAPARIWKPAGGGSPSNHASATVPHP